MIDHAVLQDTRANRDLFARVLISEIDGVVAPLLRLDERARASIIALVGAAQLITAYQRSLNNAGDTVGDDFDAILYSLHPDGAALLAGLRTTGLAESVAYGWTLALCRSEHHDEGEVGRLADGAGRVRRREAVRAQLLRLRGNHVVPRDAVPFGEQPLRNPAAHGPEADKSEICHAFLLLRSE